MASCLKMDAYKIEGRWYSEIRRTHKNGHNFDWKTILNSIVLKQLEANDRSTGLIDQLQLLFQKSPSTQQILDLLDKYKTKPNTV